MVHHLAYSCLATHYRTGILIHHLKSGFLAHGLDLADDFIDKAFLNQFRCQVGIQNNGHIVVARYIAFLLGTSIKKVILGQAHFPAVYKSKVRAPFSFSVIHGSIAVNICQGLPDPAQLFAVLRSHGLKLRFEGSRVKSLTSSENTTCFTFSSSSTIISS